MKRKLSFLCTIIYVLCVILTINTALADSYIITLNVDFEENLMFSRYDVTVCLDNTKVGTYPHGCDFAVNIPTDEGNHTIWFYEDNNTPTKGSIELDVSSNTAISCKIKCKSDKINISKIDIQSNASIPELVIESDMDVLLREGHPTYYGSVKKSHEIWSDIRNKRIQFADDFYSTSNNAFLIMSNSHNGSDIIKNIIIDFTSFTENPNLSLEEALPIAASYLPFDIMDQYYEFGRSFIAPNSAGEKYYCVTYRLNEKARTDYSHDYSGTIDVLFFVKGDVVQSIDICFGTPRWFMNVDYQTWDCNLYDYRNN